MSIIQGTSKSSAAAGYSIDQSIRFNDDDSARMTRTPGSAGNRRTFTFSAWIKRGYIAAQNSSDNQDAAAKYIFSASGNDRIHFSEQSQAGFGQRNDGIHVEIAGSGSGVYTTARFSDPGSWYHLVVEVDTTQATASNRIKIYINGSQQTDFDISNYPAQNADSAFNNTVSHMLGGRVDSTSNFFDGYLAEINFIDGTALDPTSFGETNADTGQWVPIAYTGSYGTNGFYITGANSADLGADDSGNGNNFTSSGLAAADQVSDSPTDNFCTWNPLKTNASATLSDGNLNYTASGAQRTTSTFAVNSGKWYAEFTISAATGNQTWGVVDIAQVSLSDAYIGQRSYEWGIDGLARTWNNGSNAADYTDFTAGDVIGIALDMDNGKVWFRDNDGTFLSGGDPAAGTTPDFSGLSGDICFAAQFTGGNVTINCGQSAYTNTPPTGFNALSTANLDDPTIADPTAYMQSTLYTGNGVGSSSGGQEINQSGNSTFQPDFVWIKVRNLGTETHCLQDVVRGANKRLQSNSTAAENTETEGLLSFDSDGFTVGSRDPFNKNTATYVGWQWLAGNTSGSSNTDGSTTSTVSASTTSGFSIVKWTGTGANTTLGHGLGVAPQMILVKNLVDADSWVVYHEDVGATKGLTLDTTAATTTASTFFNNTAPTSSVFSVGSGGRTNGSSDGMIAYCFAEVEGFSKFGSYTGNGSTDGPFIYTGFRPKWIMYKRTSGGTGNWDILDAERDPINVADAVLAADKTTAETTYSTIKIDMLSNGYKIRGTQTNLNASGSTYIVMAFAESPFKTATAR